MGRIAPPTWAVEAQASCWEAANGEPPRKGKRRRAKATEPKRSWVEVEQLPSLIEAAKPGLRPLVATLAGTGLRIGEAVALDWRDVKLGAGTLIVRESKTDAGQEREVDLPMGLQEELATWKARSPRTRPDDPVFLSGRPGEKRARQTERNAQARFKTAVEDANKKLSKLGIDPIGNVSPHSLRRTYASLRAALRDDPVYIAEQLGHTDARFTFRVYQRAAKRRERLTGRYLEQFDAVLLWAQFGHKEASGPALPNLGSLLGGQQTASVSEN